MTKLTYTQDVAQNVADMSTEAIKDRIFDLDQKRVGDMTPEETDAHYKELDALLDEHESRGWA